MGTVTALHVRIGVRGELPSAVREELDGFVESPAAGARLLCLPSAGKLDLEIFEDYLIRYRPKFFYTMSDFQNPTGRVMSLSDRIIVMYEGRVMGELTADAATPERLGLLMAGSVEQPSA